jgi:hypothetical protein
MIASPHRTSPKGDPPALSYGTIGAIRFAVLKPAPARPAYPALTRTAPDCRALASAALSPISNADDRAARGDPFTPDLAARQLAGLEEVVDGIGGDGEQVRHHMDIEDIRLWSGTGSGTVLFRWAFVRHCRAVIRECSGLCQ